MKKILFSSLLIFSFFLLAIPTDAHRSGCHRWHSCPSDSGSYICGDWGYCSGCPDNEYCKNRQPITSNVTINITPSSQSSSTPSDLISTPSSSSTTTTTTNITCRGTFQGIVERIIDGDTLAIKGCDKNIRLSLVDTPEKNKLGYTEAKNFISNLCANSTAVIDEDDGQKEGSYGRIVAVVYCQNKNINAEILSNNLGKIDARFCSVSEFGREDWAKKYGCNTKNNTLSPNTVFCTADVKQCPDGNYVSRNPNAKCSFFSCPTSSINTTINTGNNITTTSNVSGAIISSNISTTTVSPNTSIGIAKPSNDIVDKTVLVDVLFSLELVKIKLDNLKDSALSISEYYKEKGETAKADKWFEISNSFNNVINSIDGIVSDIKQNKNNITADFIKQIKIKVAGVKVDISSVIDKILEVI